MSSRFKTNKTVIQRKVLNFRKEKKMEMKKKEKEIEKKNSRKLARQNQKKKTTVGKFVPRKIPMQMV